MLIDVGGEEVGDTLEALGRHVRGRKNSIFCPLKEDFRVQYLDQGSANDVTWVKSHLLPAFIK